MTLRKDTGETFGGYLKRGRKRKGLSHDALVGLLKEHGLPKASRRHLIRLEADENDPHEYREPLIEVLDLDPEAVPVSRAEARREIRTLVREELIDVLRKEQFPRLESLASSVEDHFVATGARLDALEVQLRSLRRRRGGEGEG